MKERIWSTVHAHKQACALISRKVVDSERVLACTALAHMVELQTSTFNNSCHSLFPRTTRTAIQSCVNHCIVWCFSFITCTRYSYICTRCSYNCSSRRGRLYHRRYDNPINIGDRMQWIRELNDVSASIQAYCGADGSNDVAIPSARCSEGCCWSTVHTHKSSSVEIISISVVDRELVNACPIRINLRMDELRITTHLKGIGLFPFGF